MADNLANNKQFWSDNTVSAFRTALIAGGTALATLDLMPQTEIDKWIGIIMPIVTFVWIIFSNFKVQTEKQDVKVSGVQVGQALGLAQALPLQPTSALPQVMSEAEVTAKLNTGEIQVPEQPKKESTP